MSSTETDEEEDEEYELVEYESLTEADFFNSEWKIGTLWNNKKDIDLTWVRLTLDGDQNVAIWGDGNKGKWKIDEPSQFFSISKETFGGWGGKKIWAGPILDYYFLDGSVRGWNPLLPASVLGQWQMIRLGVEEEERGTAPWFEEDEETIMTIPPAMEGENATAEEPEETTVTTVMEKDEEVEEETENTETEEAEEKAVPTMEEKETDTTENTEEEKETAGPTMEKEEDDTDTTEGTEVDEETILTTMEKGEEEEAETTLTTMEKGEEEETATIEEKEDTTAIPTMEKEDTDTTTTDVAPLQTDTKEETNMEQETDTTTTSSSASKHSEDMTKSTDAADVVTAETKDTTSPK